MKTLLVLSILIVSSISQARHIDTDQYNEMNVRYLVNQQNDCVSEYITPVSQREFTSKSCHVTIPLRMTHDFKNYPNLHQNPRTVQFWEGQAGKEIATVSLYSRELVDTCRGRIISKSSISQTEKSIEAFDIRNPNLDDAINESFMLSPMTNQEASSEMNEAMHRCMAK